MKPGFTDRIKAHSDAVLSREQADREEAERRQREAHVVHAGYENALRLLVRTCAEAAREANLALPEDRRIDVEEEDGSVLLLHRGYGYCVRHHRRFFFDGAPYAQGVITRRYGWRRNDVEQLGSPTFPLVVRSEGVLAWHLNGRIVAARELAEWVVESLLRDAF